MSISLKLKHSATADKVPLPADLAEGELALNINNTSPGAYLKDSTGVVRKIAGITVGGTAPATPTAGMAWLDIAVPTKPVFKVYDGTAWQGAGSGVGVGTTAPTAPAAGDLWVDTTVPTAPVLKVYNSTAFVTVTPDASETVKGIVELATAAETTTGTDATRAVHPAGLKVELDKKANLASPTFTGTPAAPTAAVGTNTTQVATTAFVHAADKWTRTGTTLSPAVATDTIKGQLVPTNGSLGFRNVLINGDLKINQRGITIAAAAAGAYGPDRWQKVDANNMAQLVEEGNYVPGATYTLSWKGGTPQVLAAPASGVWRVPNVPINSTEIQLELGGVATPFERRHLSLETLMCKRYYNALQVGGGGTIGLQGAVVFADISINFPEMRVPPTISNALPVGSSGTASDGINDIKINTVYQLGSVHEATARILFGLLAASPQGRAVNVHGAKVVLSAEL